MRINKLAGSIVILSNTLTTDAFTPTPSRVHSNTAAHHRHGQLLELNAAANKEFVNDGPFFFMKPFLSVLGFQEGRTTNFGPTIAVKESDIPSEEEQQRRREQAESDMTNIGMDERDRRKYAGEIAAKVSIGYAIVSSLFLDDGTVHGSLARFAIILPLFFSVGFTKSSEKGL
jgi:hypothetical protein